MNQKKAKQLRKLLGVKSRANRTYTTQDGAHHTQPFDAAHHKPIGACNWTKKRRQEQGTVTLSKHEPRSSYQRIKRRGITGQILQAGEQGNAAI
jgi:hypothetical protein